MTHPPPKDEDWMRRALRLAATGRGAVEPNPMVGAVVVRNDRLVGEGGHQAYGGPHAEVHALQAAGEAARGATLYVTLEPCCHFGKTPPCTQAILAAGITRVVVAMADPFPQVAGGGLDELRRAGVAVTLGICRAEAEALNAAYLTLLRLGRPWIIAKWAMTLDGRIATRTGDSRWISSETSRARVHQRRGQVDGILVGSGTALADDPALTARPPGPRRATRVILDRRGRLPPSAQVVRTARETPTWILSEQPNPAWREAGCEVSSQPLRELFAEMGRRRWTNVLVEGGAGILGALFDAELIDEVEVYVAPCLVGGANARGPVGGIGVARMAEAWRLQPHVESIDNDILICTKRHPSPPQERP
jgi:diaminohydroxyphosphoribosylaminopyrimidine deaminase/5-amino-6-(5-phosphoribosylamino)uracil reductase